MENPNPCRFHCNPPWSVGVLQLLKPRCLVGLVLCGSLLAGMESLGAVWQYTQDFEGVVGAEWSRQQIDVTPVGQRRFLGRFGNDTVSLTLSSLPPHQAVTVSLDLFIINSWDAHGPVNVGGPDVWDLSVAGGPTLLHTTFSNTGYANPFQAYPDNYPGADHPAGTGAVESNTLGYGDAVYHLIFTFQHRASGLSLNFTGQGLQELWDESWGVDNVSVALSPPDGGLYIQTELVPVGVLSLTNQGPVRRIAVSGQRALVTAGDRSVHLVDLSTPSSPTLLGTWHTPCPVSNAQLMGSMAYVASYETNFLSTVEIIDFSNPAKPSIRGYYDTAGYAEDLAVVGTTIYVADGNAGLLVLDSSNPTSPQKLARYDTKGIVSKVAAVGDYIYFVDGKWLLILDVSSPAVPVRLGAYEVPGGILDLKLVGSKAYVLEGGVGPQVLNLADPGKVQRLGTHRTWGMEAVAVLGDYACLAKGGSGLEVVDVSNPANIAWVTGATIGGGAQDVEVMDRYFLVATAEQGLNVYEVRQTPWLRLDAPVISGETMTLSWPAVEGVRLQKSFGLSAPSWQEVPGSEITNTMTLPMSENMGLYRLVKP